MCVCVCVCVCVYTRAQVNFYCMTHIVICLSKDISKLQTKPLFNQDKLMAIYLIMVLCMIKKIKYCHFV